MQAIKSPPSRIDQAQRAQRGDLAPFVARIEAALPDGLAAQQRMFGGVTFLINGSMLCCASRKGLMVRVGAAAEAKALASAHARPCLGAGRRMAGFILVAPAGLSTASDLRRWLSMARRYVEALPPKAQTRTQRGKTAPSQRTHASQGDSMTRHLLSVLAYVIATLATQATSHFAVFAGHYAAVSHIKSDPIFPLGLLAMVIQGSILSLAFVHSKLSNRTVWSGVLHAWAFGAFLVSYIAFAEAAKYAVPNVLTWIGVELLVGFVQFTLIGVLVALAHRST